MSFTLPIYEIESEILKRIQEHRRLILTAPTGSGKSTQVPQMLLKVNPDEKKRIVTLQPRRLATRLLATRVAEEMGCRIGEMVGYQIRFENRTGSKTRIEFVTEGILLRRMITDPQLRGIGTLIFDEFHERNLYGDVTLAHAFNLQKTTRPDLVLIIMSATIQTQKLTDYLRPCSVLESTGRTYPVDIVHQSVSAGKSRMPVWEQAADAFSEFIRSGEKGDVLIFMPGSFEIHQTLEAIRHRPEQKGHTLLPLHGELPSRDQDAAVAQQEKPKVVVATNVAETSLTIHGIRLVIDSGLARLARYDPYRGINTLFVEKISQAAADQRAGRAGRTQAGKCIRLWSEQDHQQRFATEIPEIRRLDLSEIILTLKSIGIEDVEAFPWLESPEPKRLNHAVQLLKDLGAMDEEAKLTEVGKRMAAFPLHPRYSRMLLAANKLKCVQPAALVASLTQGRDILLRNPDRNVKSFREDRFGAKASSDFLILIRAWNYAAENSFRLDACRKAGIHASASRLILPVFRHFMKIAEKQGLNTTDTTASEASLLKCLLTGFSDRLAKRVDEGTLRCELAHGGKGVLSRESVVHHSPLFIAAEIREVQMKGGELNTLLSLASSICKEWLIELYPDEFKSTVQVQFQPSLKCIVAERQERFRNMTLSSERIDPPPVEASARLLAEEIIQGKIPLKSWDHTLDQWIIRLNNLVRWCPEFELPPLTDEDRRHLIEQFCHGAFSVKELKNRSIKSLVKSWLSDTQKDLLNQQAPERLKLANNRNPKVTYVDAESPYISLRIQEIYDVNETPRIAMNRIPVLMHILAPNMREVQITQDLARFWTDHYPKLKQQLQRRYPKHEWR